VDRKFFCPRNPYEDAPQGLGYAATISAPHMHAEMLEALLPILTPGAKILDVGSGSGYLLACFAEIVGETGVVVGVEHIPELAQWSKSNLERSGLAKPNIRVITGDGRLGVPGEQFDAIHVGAAAPNFTPALMEQLKIGGRMVLPVESGAYGQTLYQVDRTKDGYEKHPLMGVIFVPLTDRDEQYTSS